MAIGTKVQLKKDEWVQLTADGDDFVIQNIGNANVILKYSDAIPSEFSGHVVEKYDGISSATFGTGNVFGTAQGVSTMVEVTK